MTTKRRQKPKGTTEADSSAGVSCAPRTGSPVLVVPLDTAPESLAELRAAGYVPVMTNEPDKVRIVISGSQVVGNDLLMAAMAGVDRQYNDDTKRLFVSELHRRMKLREDQGND